MPDANRYRNREIKSSFTFAITNFEAYRHMQRENPKEKYCETIEFRIDCVICFILNRTLVLYWTVYSAIKTNRCRYLKMVRVTRSIGTNPVPPFARVIFPSHVNKCVCDFILLNGLKLQISLSRLVTISTLCGIAGTICTVCSYQRVPCHLQDPLKGFTLAFAILFYFFFCKKGKNIEAKANTSLDYFNLFVIFHSVTVMGLQKIFSATTSVVGLFISVDYGLCDEFRCRGVDLGGIALHPSTGWQGHAVWTILYVVGVALWTLHLSLLEGEIVQFNDVSFLYKEFVCEIYFSIWKILQKFNTVPPNNLLTTVSRIVSNTETLSTYKPEQPKPPKKKPKALHVTMWIQIFSLFVTIVLGWIDLLPASGPVSYLKNGS